MDRDLAFLGIDQGTSGTKGVLINAQGETLAEFSAEVNQRKRDGLKVEQDPESLLNSVEAIIDKVVTVRPGQAKGIGLAFQRSGVTAWNRQDGKALHPLITWDDTRTQDQIDKLGTTQIRITDLTALPVLPNFAAPKIALLHQKYANTDVLVGTLDSFVLYKLSGASLFVTEDTMAARTMLYGIKSGKWEPDLARFFNVNEKRLPVINPSIHHHGTTRNLPILAMIGDQQAAYLGRFTNDAYPLLNLGTIASLLVGTKDRIVRKPGLMSSVLYSTSFLPHRPGSDREYSFLAELTSSVTGTLLQEIVTEKKLAPDFSKLSEICFEHRKTRPLGATVYSVLGKPRNPSWPQGTPDVFVEAGETNTADELCAWVENVGNHILSMFEQMEGSAVIFEDTLKPRVCLVAGGGSEVDYLLQYIADCGNIEFHRLSDKQATARGAALAALMAKIPKVSLSDLNKEVPSKVFKPIDPSRRRRFLGWQRLEREVLAGTIPQRARVTHRKLDTTSGK